TFLDSLEDKYIQSEFEEALGNIDPTLRQAAYFARNINSATDVYSILGDKVLRDVVQKTLNLPAEMAYQPVETQARAITTRLKIDQFGADVAKNNISASDLKRAKEDSTIIDNNLKISDAALAQIKAIQDKVTASISAYDSYASKTFDPAEIAAQQEAIPQLLRFEQLLNAGGTAIGNVTSSIQKLQSLTTKIQSATTPEAIDSLKTQFNSLIDTIGSQLSSAGVTTPTTYDKDTDGGTPPTESLLGFGADTVLTAQLKANGTNNLDITAFSTSDLTAFLDNAKAAFGAVADKNDTGNISSAINALTSALNRGNAIKSSITSDTAELKDKMDDVTYGVSMDSDEIIKGKRSLDDAMTRTQTIVSLLDQITTLSNQSAAMVTGADRSALQTKYENLRTQLINTVNTPTAAGLDNLLTSDDMFQYELLQRPADGGGTEQLYMYSKGVKSSIDDIINDLNAGSIASKADAQAMAIKSIQLTNRTDTAARVMTSDSSTFNRTLSNYDTKGKIDIGFFDLQRDLDKTIAAAAVGSANLLSSDQSEISFTVSSSTSVLRMKPAKTFQTDMLAQLSNVVSQFGNGLAASREAADDLNDALDRSRRFLVSDNRNISFEQGRIGAIIDMMEPDTAEDGTLMYKTNSFTEKFISRYLTLNSSSTPTFSSSQASALSLYSGSTDSSSLMSSILTLSMKI
ncbi:MAG TPA: DUF1217 domain-containing protein, partial [Alphaproteobacteria bacterium]